MPSVNKDFYHYSLWLRICATSLINENQMKVDSTGGRRALGGRVSAPGALPGLSEGPCTDPPPFGALRLIAFGDLFTNGELEEARVL